MIITHDGVHSSRTSVTPVRRANKFGRRGAAMAQCVGAGILFLALMPAASAQSIAPGTRIAEGRILVQPRVGLPDARFQQLLNRAGGRSVGKLRRLDVHIVEVAPQAEAAVLRALSRNRNVQFAEPDQLVELSETVPNDPNYPAAWHLQTIGAPVAWDTASGGGVTVAILDTDTLEARILEFQP